MSREIKSLPLHLRMLAEARRTQADRSTVSGSFVWSGTPEGSTFWGGVNKGDNPSFIIQYTPEEANEVFEHFPHPDAAPGGRLGTPWQYVQVPTKTNCYWGGFPGAKTQGLPIVNWSEIRPKPMKKIIGYKTTRYMPGVPIGSLFEWDGDCWKFEDKAKGDTYFSQEQIDKDSEWFTPVYETKSYFKAGDFVVVEDFGTLHWKSRFTLGKAYQLTYNWPAEGFHVKHDDEGSTNGFGSSDHMSRMKVRAATATEIEEATTVKIKVGHNNSLVTIKNGKVTTRNGSDDYSINKLEQLRDTIMVGQGLTLGSFQSSIDHEVQFIRVGCNSEGPLISMNELKTIINTANSQK